MSEAAAYGIGLCPTASGAVIAVVRDGPLRLAAVAEVPGGPAHWRGLARARRLLGVPRWCPVTVVTGQFAGPGGATLARAGLDLSATVEPGRLGYARERAASELTVDARLAATMGDESGQLAVAAALEAVRPVAPVAVTRHPALVTGGDAMDAVSGGGGGGAGQWGDLAAFGTGWAVERINR
ncbi:hypothetical protein [Micromonospora sp. NBC_01813]|uniref:hypothetical protein n=1 Tax=Micromonospora sp. NBC_01813 TaxID=2975988 RepID=UPI002DD92081|nr:hypothetical protein [Micromonospora sp. NBC_01813]WSA10169.1 hypothetical protein OG958_05060 [Micromonospora sp. NBC_01813]